MFSCKKNIFQELEDLDWEKLSKKYVRVKGDYCDYKLKASTVELIKFIKKNGVPKYDSKDVKKSLWYKFVKQKKPNLTERGYNSAFFGKPFVNDLAKSIFFPTCDHLEFLMWQSHTTRYNPEDYSHSMVWDCSKVKYRDVIENFSTSLNSFNLIDFGIRLWDWNNFSYLNSDDISPFKFGKWTVDWDGSESTVWKISTNFESSREYYSGYWSDTSIKWLAGCTHTLGILCYLDGGWFGNASDTDIFDAAGLNEFMVKNNEYGIADLKFSKYDNIFTKNDVKGKAKKVLTSRRSKIEHLIGRFKMCNCLCAPFRHNKRKFESYLFAIGNLVFLDTLFYPLRKRNVYHELLNKNSEK